jgi:hypothetical protein
VLIFNAREHIGHTDASITVSTLPSGGMVSCSLDAPLTEVKLPKTSRQPPRAVAWRRWFARRATNGSHGTTLQSWAIEPPGAFKNRQQSPALVRVIRSLSDALLVAPGHLPRLLTLTVTISAGTSRGCRTSYLQGFGWLMALKPRDGRGRVAPAMP